jgi:hypothetical protein
MSVYIVTVNRWTGEQGVSDSSNMLYGIWLELGTMRPQFSFTGKTGINIDLGPQ